MKKIISTLLATSMLASVVTPVAAELVSNGGKPSISLTQIQANLDNGTYTNYPGVIRLNDFGVRVGPSGKGTQFLFGKTFEPGMALPEVTDFAALRKAIDSKETILVASNEWILPVPAVFVELGRQNGVDGATFMAHYLEATAGIDSDAFGEYAIAQTQAVIDTLGVTQVEVDPTVLVATGLTEAQAQAIADAAASLAVEEANKTIASLTAENMTLVGTIATLTTDINTLNANIESLTEAHAAEVNRLDAQISGLRGSLDFASSISRSVTSDLQTVSRALGFDTTNVGWAGGIGNQDRLDAIAQLQSDVRSLNTQVAGLTNGGVNTVAGAISSTTTTTTTSTTVEQYTPSLAELGNVNGYVEIYDVNAGHLTGYGSVVNGEVVSIHADIANVPAASVVAGNIGIFSNADASQYSFISDAVDRHEINAINRTVAVSVPVTTTSWSFDGHAISVELAQAINEAIDEAYDQGYADGYADGYDAGFADGVASVS